MVSDPNKAIGLQVASTVFAFVGGVQFSEALTQIYGADIYSLLALLRGTIKPADVHLPDFFGGPFFLLLVAALNVLVSLGIAHRIRTIRYLGIFMALSGAPSWLSITMDWGFARVISIFYLVSALIVLYCLLLDRATIAAFKPRPHEG